MRETRLIISENEIPKDYVYDTENSWVYEYRNKYTGDVIQIAKEPPLYIKTALLIEELEHLRGEILGNVVITLKGEKDKAILEHNKIIYSNVEIIDKRIAKLKGE